MHQHTKLQSIPQPAKQPTSQAANQPYTPYTDTQITNTLKFIANPTSDPKCKPKGRFEVSHSSHPYASRSISMAPFTSHRSGQYRRSVGV
ncbi:hypothetical protein EYC80_000690 [Monilinia laxa]|uniref:Uncharacterized protein n=1 Tax=Monilinia laxa TaxID=61186 RepID=A0A5N6KCM6_MONLA|nr:hypothetical protein EYC80_000690 [Monilinia laxa]